ncbi:tetratricopeptide repeat protein [Corallococcus sp. bb12-1]|uniref:tetratricopeptide repeat protein n=1 Tax=Corallococcus sp. bb12-1 TaxID=2996784 RepID=UPI002270E334|nr:tetratricopeptide repeat protein [Corallococcus sp. bb12-1]MCY1045180.1 tetratricopeptide repeat protein [Corallococcus sp. bb12-1]
MTTESKATVLPDNEKPLSAAEMLERATEGFNLFQDGRFSEALAIFENLLAMDASEAYFHTALGACHLALEDLDQAVGCFNRAIELDPTDITPFVNRGEAALRQGKLTEAAQDFNRAVALDPEGVDPLSARARMLAAAAMESAEDVGEAEAPEDDA